MPADVTLDPYALRFWLALTPLALIWGAAVFFSYSGRKQSPLDDTRVRWLTFGASYLLGPAIFTGAWFWSGGLDFDFLLVDSARQAVDANGDPSGPLVLERIPAWIIVALYAVLAVLLPYPLIFGGGDEARAVRRKWSLANRVLAAWFLRSQLISAHLLPLPAAGAILLLVTGEAPLEFSTFIILGAAWLVATAVLALWTWGLAPVRVYEPGFVYGGGSGLPDFLKPGSSSGSWSSPSSSGSNGGSSSGSGVNLGRIFRGGGGTFGGGGASGSW